MNEELIAKLDELGVTYDETAGTIDIADVDKSVLIEIISFLNDNAITFSIDDSAITVSGMETGEEETNEEYAGEETEAVDQAYADYGAGGNGGY